MCKALIQKLRGYLRNLSDIRYLYRYQRMPKDNEPEYTERMEIIRKLFSHSELYADSPKNFNDPFDCKVDFTFDGCTDKDIRKFIEKKQKYLKRNIDVEKEYAAAIGNKLEWQQNVMKSAIENLQPETDKMGVLCFSKHRDDILMWSHYSDGHKGFCLEFDKERLEAWKYCRRVDYEKKYLPFKKFNDAFPDNDNKEKLIQLLLLRKSKHWKYESEWRIIVKPEDDNSGSRYYKFPEELLTGVIFGCQMADDKRRVIKDFLKNRKNHVQCYEAKKKENEFALEIKELG